MSWFGYGIGWLWALFVGLLWLLFVILLVLLVVWLLRSLSRQRRPGGGARTYDRSEEDGALAILRERYARGEITREQYAEMRAALKE